MMSYNSTESLRGKNHFQKKKKRNEGINEKIYTMMSFDRFCFTETHGTSLNGIEIFNNPCLGCLW